MAKHISVLISVLILVVLMNINDVAAKNFPPNLEECKIAEKATDDDLINMRMTDQPKTRPMKCVLTCLGEKSGKISNNQLNTEGVLNSIKTLPNYSEQMQKSVNEVLEESKQIQDPDRCEFGAKLMACLMEGAMKRGIKDVFNRQKHHNHNQS